MKNTSTITLILLTMIFSIPQMAQSAIEGCSNKVTQITEIPLSAIVPALASDPRKNVKLDEGVAKIPELKSIARVKINGAGNAVTGSLVGKCHVLVSFHIVAPYALNEVSGKLTKLAKSPKDDSAGEVGSGATETCSNQDTPLLGLSDSQLNEKLSFSVGFLPDGTNRRHEGFEKLAQGKLILSGRDAVSVDTVISEDEDWAIIQIPASKARGLKPIEIASNQEVLKVGSGMKAKKLNDSKSDLPTPPNALVAGFSADLFARDLATGLYFQTCILDSLSSTESRTNCIATNGYSGAPVLIFPGGTKNPPKIATILKRANLEGNTQFLLGTSQSRFKEKIETLERDYPCQD